MMTKFYELSKKNKVFSVFIRLVVYITMLFISLFNELCGSFRELFPAMSKYKGIKAYKNKYMGKRCFIICTGPSLTIEDLEMLKSEYTFGMNSMCLLSGKMEFYPTFYGCIDEGVYLKLKDDINKFCEGRTQVFVSDRILKYKNVPLNWQAIPVNVAYHTYDRWFNNKFWCKFSNDVYRLAYDMFSVTHVLIQLAVYMGFKEIYLLGCDCNQAKGEQVHFQDYGVPDATIDTARERNIAGFKEVKRYADANGISLYNATRGGQLEVFERRVLEEVLQQ